MTGSKIPEEFNTPEDMTDEIFKTLDKDSDDQISLEEFLESANKVQILVDILQIDPE